jgi:DNA-binding NtrC family response regulator
MIDNILTALESVSIETIVVRSFQEVIPNLKKGKYPLLILSNLGLPPFNIPTTVSNVRKSDHEIIIWVMSGYDNIEFINDLKTRGVDYFLRLPFDIQAFSNNVKNII